MKEFLAKFGLDSHHRMERFGVSFVVLVACLAVTTCSIFFKVQKDNKQELTTKAKYTTEFVTSRTGISGTVEEVYANKEHTKAFVLLKFDNVDSISTDAKNYQLFLTGSSLDMSPTHLNINPSGAIYMFGTSGYMGIYLVASRGFENQILDLTVRNNKELSVNGDTDVSAEEFDGDASFAKSDQFRIYFNAGGADAVQAKFMESSETIDITTIYEEIVARPQEMEIRDALTIHLKSLKAAMETVSEYDRRLDDAGIVVPELPEEIDGDMMVNQDGDVVASLSASQRVVDGSDDDTLYLKADRAVSRGVDFNWQDGSIAEGYLEDLAEDLTPAQYLSSIAVDSVDTAFSTNELEFYRTDGTLFDSSNVVGQSDQDINRDITSYLNALRGYYDAKTKYETSNSAEYSLISLLELEERVLNADRNFTINDSENVLYNWQSK